MLMVPSAVESYKVSMSTKPVISVGLLLRAARERQGRTIPDIATDLCLMQSYLRAIEADDLAGLPGLFFYRSFVRQYATLVGIDTETLMPALNAMTSPSGAEPQAASSNDAAASAVAKSAASRSIGVLPSLLGRPDFSKLDVQWTTGLLVLSLAVCSGFYALWADRPDPASLVAAAATPEVMLNDAAISPPGDVATEASNPVGSIAVIGEASANDRPGPIAETSAAPGATLGVAPNVASAEATPAVQLSLSASELTWLSISSQGRQIFSGVLQPSEFKTISGVDAATLKTGNAGGVEVRWNGKPLGPIGGRGEVRTVLLTPGNVEILAPAKSL